MTELWKKLNNPEKQKQEKKKFYDCDIVVEMLRKKSIKDGILPSKYYQEFKPLISNRNYRKQINGNKSCFVIICDQNEMEEFCKFSFGVNIWVVIQVGKHLLLVPLEKCWPLQITEQSKKKSNRYKSELVSIASWDLNKRSPDLLNKSIMEQLLTILRYSKSNNMVKNHHKFGKPDAFVCNRSNCDLNMKDYFQKHKPHLEEVLEKTVLIIEQPLFEQPDNGLTVDDNYLEDNILKNSIDVVDNTLFLEKIVAIIIMVITIGGLLGKHFFIAHFISENAVLNEYICEDEKPISKKLKNSLRKQKQKQKEQELQKQQQTTTEEQEEQEEQEELKEQKQQQEQKQEEEKKEENIPKKYSMQDYLDLANCEYLGYVPRAILQEEDKKKNSIFEQIFPKIGNENEPKTNQRHDRVGNWKNKLFSDKNEAATPNAPNECAVKAEKSESFLHKSWADMSLEEDEDEFLNKSWAKMSLEEDEEEACLPIENCAENEQIIDSPKEQEELVEEQEELVEELVEEQVRKAYFSHYHNNNNNEYGFIATHMNGLLNRGREYQLYIPNQEINDNLTKGDVVEFTLGYDFNGREIARNVRRKVFHGYFSHIIRGKPYGFVSESKLGLESGDPAKMYQIKFSIHDASPDVICSQKGDEICFNQQMEIGNQFRIVAKNITK